MKTLNILILLIGFTLTIHANAAICSFEPSHKQSVINVDLPATLSIPRDTPNGTIIYESPETTFTNVSSSFNCLSAFNVGIRNNIGVNNAGSKIFPIGTTGLGWSWGRGAGTYAPSYPDLSLQAGHYGANGSIHNLTIVKIGNTDEVQKIPAGIIGEYIFGGLSVITMNVITAITILPQSCETPDVKVNMGEHDISGFAINGSVSDSINFSINLNNCPPGINKVSYLLKPTPASPALNPINGVVGLSTDSTALGLALQLLDGDGGPIVLNQSYQFSDYSTGGGNFNIPLRARYFRIAEAEGRGGFDKGMRAGSANASVSFIMSYL